MYKLVYPFNAAVVPEIKEYLLSMAPEEAAVIVADDKVFKLTNIIQDAEQRKEAFEFDEGIWLDIKSKHNVQAFIHSHTNVLVAHASASDMSSQHAMCCPFGIVAINEGMVVDIFFWGDQIPIAPLLGRPFHHGAHDCYGLVRDYYRSEKGVTLADVERDYGWWKTDPPQNIIEDNIVNMGFKVINFNELAPGDIILFKIRYKVVNHSAVYLGGGLILHHFCAPGVVSRREPLSRWRNMITHCLRYVGDNNV